MAQRYPYMAPLGNRKIEKLLTDALQNPKLRPSHKAKLQEALDARRNLRSTLDGEAE